MCRECNNERLEAKKPKKVNTLLRSSKESSTSSVSKLDHKVKQGERVKIKQGGRATGKNLLLDELFYEECFNLSNHECEECGKNLPTEFRDDRGRVIARFRYSHIVAKSIAPELRHNINNINHLCHKCHFKWDFQDRENMIIYSSNKVKFPQYLK